MIQPDVIVLGGGHNGLVAATFLARAKLDVLVLEEKSVVGGAAKTEHPFTKVPELGTSTGAYLLGLMAPELIAELGVEIPTVRRDPHYFLPTTGDKYLLFGRDAEATRRQMRAFFSEADVRAYDALESELSQLRDDVAPAWLAEPCSIEETAERHVRPALRRAFVELCREPVRDYLDRFGFASDLVKAMYAVTDGFSGLLGTWDTPGTGLNFLAHNMCRLPGADGTWMVVKGGMGTVTRALASAATKAGARIETGAKIAEILVEHGVAKGVRLADGREVFAKAVVCNADPFKMTALAGGGSFPAAWHDKLRAWTKDGSTLKVNLALRGLPKFRCLPEDRGQHQATIHLLPDEARVLASLTESFEAVRAGRLAEFPTIEWYIHTTVDPTLRDAAGHHNSALFVQWVPYDIAGSSWAVEEPKYVKHLLSICDRFAPGTSELVVDTFALNPQTIESHFGITRGHIHHVDNSFGFTDRVPYATPLPGLYACGAGCHPGGGVIGAAGRNAARRVIADLGR